MADTETQKNFIERQIDTVTSSATVNANAMRESVSVLSNTAHELTSTQLQRLRSGLKNVRDRGLTELRAIDANMAALQTKIEERIALEKPIDTADLQRAADSLPPVVKEVTKGALQGTEYVSNAAISGIKDAAKDISEGNYTSGGLKGLGIGSAIVVGGYLVWKVLKNTVGTVVDGVKHSAEWLWDHKWTILTLGAVGAGSYMLLKKDENKDKPEAELGGTDILGKEQTINGKKVTVQKEGITVNGSTWKIEGEGMAGALDFSVLQAKLEPNGSLHLEIQGSGYGQTKKATQTLGKLECEAFLKALELGVPPKITVPTGVNIPLVPKEVTVTLRKTGTVASGPAPSAEKTDAEKDQTAMLNYVKNGGNASTISSLGYLKDAERPDDRLRANAVTIVSDMPVMKKVFSKTYRLEVKKDAETQLARADVKPETKESLEKIRNQIAI